MVENLFIQGKTEQATWGARFALLCSFRLQGFKAGVSVLRPPSPPVVRCVLSCADRNREGSSLQRQQNTIADLWHRPVPCNASGRPRFADSRDKRVMCRFEPRQQLTRNKTAEINKTRTEISPMEMWKAYGMAHLAEHATQGQISSFAVTPPFQTEPQAILEKNVLQCLCNSEPARKVVHQKIPPTKSIYKRGLSH